MTLKRNPISQVRREQRAHLLGHMSSAMYSKQLMISVAKSSEVGTTGGTDRTYLNEGKTNKDPITIQERDYDTGRNDCTWVRTVRKQKNKFCKGAKPLRLREKPLGGFRSSLNRSSSATTTTFAMLFVN